MASGPWSSILELRMRRWQYHKIQWIHIHSKIQRWIHLDRSILTLVQRYKNMLVQKLLVKVLEANTSATCVLAIHNGPFSDRIKAVRVRCTFPTSKHLIFQRIVGIGLWSLLYWWDHHLRTDCSRVITFSSASVALLFVRGVDEGGAVGVRECVDNLGPGHNIVWGWEELCTMKVRFYSGKVTSISFYAIRERSKCILLWLTYTLHLSMQAPFQLCFFSIQLPFLDLCPPNALVYSSTRWIQRWMLECKPSSTIRPSQSPH